MRYYISDCHFYHEKLLERMDKRGFSSVEEMNQYMIDKWNNKVRKNDEVVILGDLSWGKLEQTKELLSKLNGTLFMVRGNHDHFLDKTDFDKSRFVWIRDYAEIYDNKRKVILCHYPIMCYNGQYRLDKKGCPKTYMLYGHVHDTFDQRLIEDYMEKVKNSVRDAILPDGTVGEMKIPCNMINCFCMYSDYEPLSLDEWIVCQEERLRRQKNTAAI